MNQELPRAVLLDMDDTLLDYSSCIDRCWEEACAVIGSDGTAVREAIRAYGRWYWGDPARAERGRLDLEMAHGEIVAAVLEQMGRPDASAARHIAADYTARHDGSLSLFPEAIEVLTALRERSVKLALLTNGHHRQQRPKIARFGLEPFFDCIVIEGEFGTGKPDARVFRHALEAIGARVDEAWMIGDRLEADIAGAVSLGIHAIWRDVAGAGLPANPVAQPDRIIRRLDEILPN